jgi:hypothetical protein
VGQVFDEIIDAKLDDRLGAGLDTFFSYWSCWQITLIGE